MAVYVENVLDARKENELRMVDIPEEGFVLQPGELYLGVTEEYTATYKHVPFLEGKSSTGRLGISIHATAGKVCFSFFFNMKGDIGFEGTWTLEISATKPVRVYAGMPIGQILYFSANIDSLVTPYKYVFTIVLTFIV
jgi:dCTP deaminase